MNIQEESLKLHEQWRGKIEVISKVPVKDKHDLSVAYTPGVAEPCKEITVNPDLSYQYTNRGNMVAVVSDGTAVLGLGDIGPAAGLPVMEGKAILFKTFAVNSLFRNHAPLFQLFPASPGLYLQESGPVDVFQEYCAPLLQPG